MKTFLTITCALALFCLAVAVPASAGTVPQLMNVQGKLTDPGGTPVTDGAYSVVFSIYNVASGGSALWQETQSVSVVSGLFSVNLGAVTPLPVTLFDSTTLWLGMKVGTDPEMTPRQRLTTSAYAFTTPAAAAAGGWVDGGAKVTLQTNSDSVGIGTVSPLAKLHVEDSSGNAIRAISRTGSGAAAGLYAVSDTWHAVLGINSNSNAAVMGRNDGTGPGVKGQNQSTGPAITGYANTGNLLELYTTPGPYLKLSVDNSGGIKFSDSTVQTTAAGPSPVAFGGIDSNATVLSEWPTGITATWNGAYSRYEVTIPGVSYIIWSYVAVVTPLTGTAVSVATGSGGGKLIVELYNSSGTKVKSRFHFVIYKP